MYHQTIPGERGGWRERGGRERERGGRGEEREEREIKP